MLSLIPQLQFVPGSRVRMIRNGGDVRHIGWDITAEILAEQYDQITAIVSGFSGNTDPIFYPRPGDSAKRRDSEGSKKLFAPTIADFNTSAFMSELTR